MTRKELAVVTADCHLAMRTWQSRPTLAGDSIYAFRQVIDTAVARGLPVIAAGDVIDKQRNGSLVIDHVVKELRRLERERLKLYFIQGQHEMQPVPWLQAVGERETAVWAHGRCFKLGGIVFQGFDWAPADQVKENLSRLQPATSVLVLHQVMHEWLGGVTATELSFSQIPDQIEMVIIGDYHEKTGVETHTNAAGNDVQVLSPGSTCLQSITEPPAKFCYVLYDDLSVEPVRLRTRPLLAPKPLSLEEHLEQFLDEAPQRIRQAHEQALEAGIPEQIARPIVYVRCEAGLKDAYLQIEKAVSPHGFLFYKELRSSESEEAKQRHQEREDWLERGLLGALDEVVPEKDSEVYRIAYRLLQAKDPREELQAIRMERLGA